MTRAAREGRSAPRTLASLSVGSLLVLTGCGGDGADEAAPPAGVGSEAGGPEAAG